MAHPDGIYVGIDLAGPANFAHTCLALEANGKLQLVCGCSDEDIMELLRPYAQQPLWIAVDAPLTYQEGGGYRDVDQALRQTLNQLGFAQLGVMAPTLNKMVYLTLRGLRLKERFSTLPQVKLFETHPGAALILSGAPLQSVYQLKSQSQALISIEIFLSKSLGYGVKIHSDHEAMAISAMMSAKRAALGNSHWQFASKIPGQPPLVL